MTTMRRLWSRLFQSTKRAPPRERFLLPKEWERLRPVLATMPDKVRVYFLVLLLEGSRMSELRLAKWDEMDLQAGVWHKAVAKNGRRQVLPLSTCACDLLRQLPQAGAYVFPGHSCDVPWSRTAVRHWWRKIRWAAGCPDVRIHDLRRTAATWMVSEGTNLSVIKDILHHSSISTTQIYAKAETETIRAALTKHAERVLRVPDSPGNNTPPPRRSE